MKSAKVSYADPRRCENCVHFHQHYVLVGQPARYEKCHSGHCSAMYSKLVKINRVCEHFVERKSCEK